MHVLNWNLRSWIRILKSINKSRPGHWFRWYASPDHSESTSWWRHQMETFSALLAICAGNWPVPGEFPTQRPVTRSFDVYFDQRPNKWLSKQSRGWWFETLSCSLWRHRNDSIICVVLVLVCLHILWGRFVCVMRYAGLINTVSCKVSDRTWGKIKTKIWFQETNVDLLIYMYWRIMCESYHKHGVVNNSFADYR